MYGGLQRSGYHGLGNTPLFTHGKISIEVQIENVEKRISVCVLPGGILPSSLLLGRDALSTFGIGLLFLPNRDASRHLRNDASRQKFINASRIPAVCSMIVRNWRGIKQIESIKFDESFFL